MGTSSNFGNMFSAAGASLFLSFLPMLPTQILLNNLLYDVSEMTIPTDNVDEELLARPAQWDIGLIRRFMAFFGPISSVYDFLTFAVMLRVFHAGPDLFRSGWFVESLTTQTLVIFVIRTRRIPFFKSRPSPPLLAATLACAAVGVALPYIGPLARLLGFQPLPGWFLVDARGHDRHVSRAGPARGGVLLQAAERPLARPRPRPPRAADRPPRVALERPGTRYPFLVSTRGLPGTLETLRHRSSGDECSTVPGEPIVSRDRSCSSSGSPRSARLRARARTGGR